MIEQLIELLQILLLGGVFGLISGIILFLTIMLIGKIFD